MTPSMNDRSTTKRTKRTKVPGRTVRFDSDPAAAGGRRPTGCGRARVESQTDPFSGGPVSVSFVSFVVDAVACEHKP